MYNSCMSLTLNEVEHIAKLARLNLTDEEKAKYCQQLSAILEHVVMLQELDTSDVPPTPGILPECCPLRPDQPEGSLSTPELLKNAPETHQNQFRVPPVFE